ncbi:hypothetical protein C7974DRAFT_412020 [Boeremia exigua]|uniref:uncharacterized protein n=1 Tax=Boeremia exigua TaxID=749465 RepID=UPI001E8DD069|nr:uncharacterized protein C7974DRAFT_412020 [Boeremia exigua]KAH6632991.1 hypothetical protein C7974DRAFT_412020 [Boeremia exigua]
MVDTRKRGAIEPPNEGDGSPKRVKVTQVLPPATKKRPAAKKTPVYPQNVRKTPVPTPRLKLRLPPEPVAEVPAPKAKKPAQKAKKTTVAAPVVAEKPQPKQTRRTTPASLNPPSQAAPSTRANPTPTPSPSSIWTPAQRSWILCHHALLLRGLVTTPRLAAPAPTVRCAWFNAFFEGYKLDQKGEPEVAPPPRYAKRAFRDFWREAAALCPGLLARIDTVTQENAEAAGGEGRTWIPVVTPAVLARFEVLHGRDTEDGLDIGTSRVGAFLDEVVRRQFEEAEPAWIAGGRASVLRFWEGTEEELAQEVGGPLAQREYIRTMHGSSGARVDVMVAKKDVYSASGAALLNMAIIRPDGYDGDINMLGADLDSLAISGEQKSRLREDIYANRVADALRERVFEEKLRIAKEAKEAKKAEEEAEKAEAAEKAAGTATRTRSKKQKTKDKEMVEPKSAPSAAAREDQV